MIAGIIFDVDGTLLDSMPIWDHAGERYLRSLGIEAAPDLGNVLFPMSMREGASYMKREYGLSFSITEIIKGVNDTIRSFYACEAKPKEGVLEFLRELKCHHVKMTAATSTDRCVIEPALERTGILRELEGLFTCSEIGVGKEKPDIYEAARQCMGTDVSSTWVAEDALHALRTARSAGFGTIGVYDASSQSQQEEIRLEADIYRMDLRDGSALFQELQAFPAIIRKRKL